MSTKTRPDLEVPVVVRNRMVVNGAGLVNYSITAGVSPGDFVVDTDPPGGNDFLLLLNGEPITDNSDTTPSNKGGQQFILVATQQIPVFDTYGLILFGALLLASLVWFAWRKKRPAKVSV